MSIETKLRHLLTMANHATSNPNEAAVAASMAARLAAQHGIDLDKLERTEAQKRTFTEARCDIKFLSRDEQARRWLCHAVSQLFACVNYSSRGSSNTFTVYVGSEVNIRQACDWTIYLWDACKRANTEHARRENYGSSSARDDARSAFRYGFCLQVAQRILAEVERMKTEGLPESGSTALVVAHYLDAERQAVQKWVDDELKLSASRKGPGVRGTMNALGAGKEAGNRVSLKRQIS